MSTTVPATQGVLNATVRAPGLRGPVILATDGHDRSDTAATAAKRIAARFGSGLQVITSLRPLQLYMAGWEAPMLPEDLNTGRRAELHASVVRQLEPVLGSRASWHLELREGHPATVIAEYAREQRASLIVMGTGGHRAVDRLLGEEITLQVIRRSPVPVLAVADVLDTPFRHAVVGIDFSAVSVRAAMMALAMIEPTGRGNASLTLVHVRPALDDPPPSLMQWTTDYENRVTTMFNRVRELLGLYVPAGVTLETRIRSGTVMESLLEVGTQVGADLMAVGTHGANWMDRLIVGSVATSVLRHAQPTVLVSPPPPAAERVRLELRITGRVALDRPEDWTGALDAFTRRNLGRRVRLEVSGHGLQGFVIESEGYRFRGATFDKHHGHVHLLLGQDGTPARHLDHGMAGVHGITIVADDERRDRAMIVEEAHGEAVLTFVD